MIATWPDEIGQIVRQRRLDLGLSQVELASRTDVTRQWLSRFEQARADVALSKVLRILRELELFVDIREREDTAARVSAEKETVARSAESVFSTVSIEAMLRAVRRPFVSHDVQAAWSQALSDIAGPGKTMKNLQENQSKALADIVLKLRAQARSLPNTDAAKDGGHE